MSRATKSHICGWLGREPQVNWKTFSLLGSTGLVTALTGCAGSAEVASSDPQTTTQAQSTTTADGGANARGDRPRGDRPHHGPPAEAFEACSGKTAGTTCSVKIHDAAVTGKCVTPPTGAPDTRIVCHPDNLSARGGPGGEGGPHPHGPHGPPPAEVFAACDGKAADAACSVTLGDRTLEGTCRPPPHGVSETRLGCAPAHPGRPPGK